MNKPKDYEFDCFANVHFGQLYGVFKALETVGKERGRKRFNDISEESENKPMFGFASRNTHEYTLRKKSTVSASELPVGSIINLVVQGNIVINPMFSIPQDWPLEDLLKSSYWSGEWIIKVGPDKYRGMGLYITEESGDKRYELTLEEVKRTYARKLVELLTKKGFKLKDQPDRGESANFVDYIASKKIVEGEKLEIDWDSIIPKKHRK
jgi:hypothetical protein